ncbi:2-dehydro-3-deoxy-6-phosphogalactonate aldolase [Thalassotalea crassostreae]|uniref:2-dehydro-3-deoxy-6-phosphogalactonate aldolase n=1 Tax=Thalassotalea crassostreae TaxID=1763536 RepID=UPI000838F5BD|nr:2-dehydro-3-deoxy-6-phosphogalactonate aldolase [Thalassotalea crassostreae]
MLQLSINPCIAILRGLQPAQAKDIGDLLYQAGIRIMEVPLNRDNAYKSIEVLQQEMPENCLIGAGTVTTIEQLETLHTMQVKLAISPNTDIAIIKKANDFGMIHTPGVATPSEVYHAYNSGARWLKLFPAGSYGTGHLKALISIAPQDANFVAVGGINANNMQQWMETGAKGVGIGDSIYNEKDSYQQSKVKIEKFSNFTDEINLK